MFVVALSMGGASACTSSTEDEICFDQREALTSNGVNLQGVNLNGISLQGVNLNGISLQGVNLNGVNLNGVNLNGAELSCDGAELELFSYIVGCALTADQAATIYVDGEPHVFPGNIGLAPEWHSGTCDTDCQGWVSACLISMSNGRGEHVEISMRGDHEGLALDDGEVERFPVGEATYYGNLFAAPVRAYACLAKANSELDRVCADLEDCPVSLEGACVDLCDQTGCADADGNHFAHTISVFRDAL